MRTTFATRSVEAKPSPGWVNRTDREETFPRDFDSFEFFIMTRQKTRIAKCVFRYQKFYGFQDLNDTLKKIKAGKLEIIYNKIKYIFKYLFFLYFWFNKYNFDFS